MSRPRYRIRYRKLDDLRLVGHHDLARIWERLLRRAEVKPAMSEGFHRRPRVNFPSALAVGIGGLEEVIELELSDECFPADLAVALAAQAPAGLSIVSVESMGDGTRFSQPTGATYEVPLPPEQVDAVRTRIAARRVPPTGAVAGDPQVVADDPVDAPDLVIDNPVADSSLAADSQAAADDAARPAEEAAPSGTTLLASPAEPWPASIRELDVVDGVLRMNLRLGEAGAVRPRDLLAALELAELESQGVQITRTRVELSP